VKTDITMLKFGGLAIFATMCAMLLLPLCGNAEQIDASQFSRMFNITFPGYTGSVTLTDFPVLIRLSKELNDFRYNNCAANGGDLRFADANGNLLAHEIDTWNPSGTSLVWVKVPSLNSSTMIKAYYGCANPPAVDPKDVWSNGYVGVWHLGESARPLRNSTSTTDIDFTHSHDNDAEPGRYDECIAFAQSDAAIGRSVKFDVLTDTSSDKYHRGGLLAFDPDGKLSGFDAISIEIWEKAESFDETYDRYMLSKRSNSGEKTDPVQLLHPDYLAANFGHEA